MNKRFHITIISVCVICVGLFAFRLTEAPREFDTERIIGYAVNPKDAIVRFYLKDEQGNHYGNFERLRSALALRGEELLFAMNGGMYMDNQLPLGLFIENGMEVNALNTKSDGYGNFYLQPNGILLLRTDGSASILTSDSFIESADIIFATQSGPMLLVDGAYHPALTKGSKNVHIRNGVGILPDGRILFAISKELINFYDFAAYFKSHGCENALYLDGFVSRCYLPEKGRMDSDGKFGVIIGVSY